MAKNKTQIRIEDFLKELSLLSQKYGMLLDANGNQSEGTPLALYAKTAKSPQYKKVGCLYYSFEGDEEKTVYNFDPKENSNYESVTLELKDLLNQIDLPKDLISEEFLSQFESSQDMPPVPDAPKESDTPNVPKE